MFPELVENKICNCTPILHRIPTSIIFIASYICTFIQLWRCAYAKRNFISRAVGKNIFNTKLLYHSIAQCPGTPVQCIMHLNFQKNNIKAYACAHYLHRYEQMYMCNVHFIKLNASCIWTPKLFHAKSNPYVSWMPYVTFYWWYVEHVIDSVMLLPMCWTRRSRTQTHIYLHAVYITL